MDSTPPLEPLLDGMKLAPGWCSEPVLDCRPMFSPLPQEGSMPLVLSKALRVPEPLSRVTAMRFSPLGMRPVTKRCWIWVLEIVVRPVPKLVTGAMAARRRAVSKMV